MGRFLESLIDHVSRAFWMYSGIAITLMAFVVVYGVATRYIFKQVDPYSYVIICILMISAVFLPMAYIEKLDGHLKVNLISRYLPKIVREILVNVVGPVLGIISIAALTWQSWEIASQAFQTGDTWGSGAVRVPTWPARMTVPIGAGLLCLVLIAKVLHYLVTLRNKVTKNDQM